MFLFHLFSLIFSLNIIYVLIYLIIHLEYDTKIDFAYITCSNILSSPLNIFTQLYHLGYTLLNKLFGFDNSSYIGTFVNNKRKLSNARDCNFVDSRAIYYVRHGYITFYL